MTVPVMVAQQVAGKAAATKVGAKAGRAPGVKAATGGKAATRRAPAADPNLERDRAAVQAIKDARPPEPEPDDDTTAPAPTSSGAGAAAPSLPMPAAAATGSGFLLGVVAWAVGLAYLRGGLPEVRRLAAAKLFNKVEGAAA